MGYFLQKILDFLGLLIYNKKVGKFNKRKEKAHGKSI